MTRYPPPVPCPEGQLVLLIDGVWFEFRRQPWTLYLLALKPLDAPVAFFLDPVLLPDRESARDWEAALCTIPPTIVTRIVALVSDGFRGSHPLAHRHGWIHQRCHFHLIAQLQGRRGRHTHLPTAPVREALYQTVRAALGTRSARRLARLRNDLLRIAHQPTCPHRLQMFARDFVRHLDAFRAYLAYPALHLPTTTNVVESMIRCLRDGVRTISSPTALQQWATAFIRLHPQMTCNGH